MFADTLLDLERSHLLALLMWASASLLTGTGILAVLAVRRATSPLLAGFALATVAWGVAELIAVAVQWSGLALRDLDGATRLDRLLWVEAGLGLAMIVLGIAVALRAWRLGGRPSRVGAGLATILQGVVLLALHGRLALYLYHTI
jgi:hypothetical protein